MSDAGRLAACLVGGQSAGWMPCQQAVRHSEDAQVEVVTSHP